MPKYYANTMPVVICTKPHTKIGRTIKKETLVRMLQRVNQIMKLFFGVGVESFDLRNHDIGMVLGLDARFADAFPEPSTKVFLVLPTEDAMAAVKDLIDQLRTN